MRIWVIENWQFRKKSICPAWSGIVLHLRRCSELVRTLHSSVPPWRDCAPSPACGGRAFYETIVPLTIYETIRIGGLKSNSALPSALPWVARKLGRKSAEKATVSFLGVLKKMLRFSFPWRNHGPLRKGKIGGMSLGFSD